MFKRKKWIAVVVLAVVIVAGSLGGVVLAQTDDSPKANLGEKMAAQAEAMWSRVAELYQEKTGTALNTEAMKESMSEARAEIQNQAMQERMQQMIDSGRITQEQADNMKQWVESKPKDMPFKAGESFMGKRPMPGRMMGGFGNVCPLPFAQQ